MRYAHRDDSLKHAVEKLENFTEDCSKIPSNEKLEGGGRVNCIVS
jgi:hypothetical protein